MCVGTRKTRRSIDYARFFQIPVAKLRKQDKDEAKQSP